MVENGTDTNALIVPANLDNISDAELMKLTGQTGGMESQGSVLSRLSINYQTEDENERPLPRGWFSLKVDGDLILAKEIIFRPFVRFYSYSFWDNAENSFMSSVQMPSLGDQFADSGGTYKCGKLTREELNKLPENDPQRVVQSSIKCNQVLYGVVSISEGKKADGKQVKDLNEIPCVYYAKGVNYTPFSTALSTLAKQKKPMIRTNLMLSAKKQKTVGNTFFVVNVKLGETMDKLSETDIPTLKEFALSVKAINESVIEKHREAVKSKSNDGDHSLAIELDGETA